MYGQQQKIILVNFCTTFSPVSLDHTSSKAKDNFCLHFLCSEFPQLFLDKSSLIVLKTKAYSWTLWSPKKNLKWPRFYKSNKLYLACIKIPKHACFSVFKLTLLRNQKGSLQQINNFPQTNEQFASEIENKNNYKPLHAWKFANFRSSSSPCAFFFSEICIPHTSPHANSKKHSAAKSQSSNQNKVDPS